MLRGFSWTAAGLGLALLAGPALAGPKGGDGDLIKGSGILDKDKGAKSCGSFGTKVEFVETPSEAAAQAKKEEKLVFVLHVSGNFEDPRFT